MYTVVAIIVISFFLLILAFVYSVYKTKIKFFITGIDAGFSMSDALLLWNVSQICELDEPTTLFFSLPALTKCMTQITNQASADNQIDSPKYQTLLSKLFAYRTKIQNESDNKKGLTSTETLESGQRLRIILPGKGVFASKIINNGKMLIITIPKKNDIITISAEEWVGKVINVYFWRKGDAQYVFDTVVVQTGIYLGKSTLYVKHSYNLTRTQKRRSVRAKCEIYADLFFIKKSDNNEQIIESKNGFRCLLQDISESGALIKIGGKGRENIKIKLQFSIQNKLIIMTGIVRKVEYNIEKNQSLLHFECTQIEQSMKNEILAYVYNMLPENEKEVLEAIRQTEDDSKNEIENELNVSETGSHKNKKEISDAQTDSADNDSIDKNQFISENKNDINRENENSIISDYEENIKNGDTIEFKYS
ncbi:MAG: PilZ domain-containing protein [Treponema sp.]|nr:PilZ domain-containing protein [Spirochaetales bacterium]MDY6191265.1 PilZ domain-containing protein [Treponema sp.]